MFNRSTFKQFSRQERGQSLVEFGLAMPVLVALLLFIVSCGQLFSAQLVLINAAREGARVGAIGAPTEAVTKTAMAYLRDRGQGRPGRPGLLGPGQDHLQAQPGGADSRPAEPGAPRNPSPDED
jgi:hypothetical protein